MRQRRNAKQVARIDFWVPTETSIEEAKAAQRLERMRFECQTGERLDVNGRVIRHARRSMAAATV